jgi:hypothetical protein
LFRVVAHKLHPYTLMASCEKSTAS